MSHIDFNKYINSFFKDNRGLAAIEAALIFPLIITVTLATFDLGNALVLNQKIITASQVTSDLLARERSISDTEIEQAVMAARLAMDPYQGDDLGIDIQGIRIESSSNYNICWEHTTPNMDDNDDLIPNLDKLGGVNEGFIRVTTQYRFTPHFTGQLIGSFDLREVSYVRGRSNAFVPMEDSPC
jgi:Flp pilus assembly protein TadG